MVTAAGLLETSHRIPNLDYDLLEVAKTIGISSIKAKKIAEEIKETVTIQLGNYLETV